MTGEPSTSLRIGDRERDEAADRLSAHAAAGRLSLEELERRLERVQAAVFSRDLLALEVDLPAASRAAARFRGAARSRGARPSPRPPLAALACLVAAVLASALVGHPIAPLFIVAVLLWRAGRRYPGHRLTGFVHDSPSDRPAIHRV